MSKFNNFKNYFYKGGYELVNVKYRNQYFRDYYQNNESSLRLHKSLIIENERELSCLNKIIDGPQMVDGIKKTELELESFSTTNKSILPVNLGKESPVKKTINLDKLYEDLVSSYEKQQSKRSLVNKEILMLVNKYGMLTTGVLEEEIDEVNELSDDFDRQFKIKPTPRKRNLLLKDYEFHREEYLAWLFLFASFIPSTLEYVPKSRYKITKKMLNHYVSSIKVDFQDKHLKKYLHRSPNLIAELIMHSKSIKSKKPPMVQCSQCKKAYRKQSIGRGRPIEYCSDACKQASWRAGKTKKNKK